MTPRTWAWMLLIGLAISGLAVAAFDDPGARTNADRAYDLASDYACPVCDGQSVAESDVSSAREIRRAIRSLVDEGRSDDEIRLFLVNRYPDIDLNPAGTGVTALVWIVPVAVVVVGAAGLIAVFRSSLRRSGAASDDDVALVSRYRTDDDADTTPGPGDG